MFPVNSQIIFNEFITPLLQVNYHTVDLLPKAAYLLASAISSYQYSYKG